MSVSSVKIPVDKEIPMNKIIVVLALLLSFSCVASEVKIAKKVPPDFPTAAVRANIPGGTVRAQLKINAAGDVVDVIIVESDPKRGGFDKAAIEALKEWKYNPGADGRTAEVKLVFRIE